MRKKVLALILILGITAVSLVAIDYVWGAPHRFTNPLQIVPTQYQEDTFENLLAKKWSGCANFNVFTKSYTGTNGISISIKGKELVTIPAKLNVTDPRVAITYLEANENIANIRPDLFCNDVLSGGKVTKELIANGGTITIATSTDIQNIELCQEFYDVSLTLENITFPKSDYRIDYLAIEGVNVGFCPG